MRRHVAEIRRFAGAVVAERRAAMAAGAAAPSGAAPDDGSAASPAAAAGGRKADLLSLLLAAGGGGEAGGGGGGGGEAAGGDAAAVDAVLNFIIAGRDTTAQALSWALYRLSRAPAAEAALLREARAALGPGIAAPGGVAAAAGYEAVKRLRYARAVLLETLRLHPSVPKNVKFAVRDDVLPGGPAVPAGAGVLWVPWAMGRRADLWGPDAADFRPERWLAGGAPPSQEVYPAFHAGPRACLGRELALLEGAYVLVALLARFRVTPLLEGAAEPGYGASLTLPMEGGLRAVLAPRDWSDPALSGD
jgi:cytochrome P450